MLSSNGAEVERMSNVGRCRIGKDGMNRVQNICRHVSSQAAEGLVTAAVVRSDWASALGPVRSGIPTDSIGHYGRRLFDGMLTVSLREVGGVGGGRRRR